MTIENDPLSFKKALLLSAGIPISMGLLNRILLSKPGVVPDNLYPVGRMLLMAPFVQYILLALGLAVLITLTSFLCSEKWARRGRRFSFMIAFILMVLHIVFVIA